MKKTGNLIFTRHPLQVDVAVKSLVMFNGQFNTDSEVRVKAGDILSIGCQAMGGYPTPELRASLGNDPKLITSDPKADQGSILRNSILAEIFSDKFASLNNIFTFLVLRTMNLDSKVF
jgi:hypothetical protein